HRTLAGGLFAGFVLATLVTRSRSRGRELAADDRAAEVTGDPIALARALRRIERAAEPTWSFAPFSTYKETDEAAERWLSTHPSTDERVERLRRMAESRGPTRRIPGESSRAAAGRGRTPR
ncbi:MAG: M48 family metallopeptidase, partial [Alkalispirochaeta sp.]